MSNNKQKHTVVKQIMDKISRLDYSLSAEDAWVELKTYIKSENLIEMEKQQIINAVSQGFDNCEEGKVRWLGEQYYNKEYGSNND